MENLVHTSETAICRASFSLVYTGLSCIVIGGTTWNIWCFKFGHGLLICILNWFPHWLDMSAKVLKDKLCKKRNYLMCWRHGPTLYNIELHIYSLSLIHNFLRRELSRQGMCLHCTTHIFWVKVFRFLKSHLKRKVLWNNVMGMWQAVEHSQWRLNIQF